MGGTGRLAWRDGCASREDEAADDKRHGGGGSRFWPGEATTHNDIHAVGRATVEANVCGASWGDGGRDRGLIDCKPCPSSEQLLGRSLSPNGVCPSA